LARTRAARMVDAIGFEPIRVFVVYSPRKQRIYLPGIRVSIFVQRILKLRPSFYQGLRPSL